MGFALSLFISATIYAQVPTDVALTSCVRVFDPARETRDLIKAAVSQDVGEAARISLIRKQLEDAGQNQSPVVIPEGLQRFRAEYLSYFKASRDIRENLVRVIEADLRMRSYKVANKIYSAGPGRYDAVIVGAGIHGVVAAAEMLRQKPNLRVLLIDANDTAAATFRYAGDVFSLNSSSRPSGPDRPALPGRGNLNELAGLPIQATDLSPLRYATAKDLGDSVVIGL